MNTTRPRTSQIKPSARTTSLIIAAALLACSPATTRPDTTNEAEEKTAEEKTAEEKAAEEKATSNDGLDLAYLREEEKLARDVYLALFERWQLPVFRNIASSEQRHLDIATAQIERRSATKATFLDAPGKFSNQTLQGLYTTFVDKGSTSLVAALEVGATIEDLDIRDLDAMIASSPEPALRTSLERLLCASGNHMRAFTSQLRRRGSDYRAQYISEARLAEVLAQEHQRCGRGRHARRSRPRE